MSTMVARRRPRSRKQDQRAASFARHLLLIATSIVILLPIGYMLLASFKSVPDFFGNPYGLPTDWAFDNYTRAWTDAHVSITLPNTIFVTLCSVLGSTFLASLIAPPLRGSSPHVRAQRRRCRAQRKRRKRRKNCKMQRRK